MVKLLLFTMIFNLIIQGLKWLITASPSLILQRPQDVIFGFIGATLVVFLFTGPSSIFWNFLEVVLTVIFMVLLWKGANVVSDKIENSVFTLPDDAATEKAKREVDEMVNDALD